MKVTLEHVNKVVKRDPGTGAIKKIYYYHRHTGNRIYGEPGTPEFSASHAAAAAVQPSAPPETFSAIIEEYKKSEDFLGLKPKPKRTTWRI